MGVPPRRADSRADRNDGQKTKVFDGQELHPYSLLILRAIVSAKSPTLLSDITSNVVKRTRNSFSTATIRLMCIRESHSLMSAAVVPRVSWISPLPNVERNV